ncbi:hypothetical protein [Pyrofollis japonicus]|uniref:hypothetical protein n=1 Tax=Pyrofollis japonicus TaxID=3060460 RepID=UPI00295B5046|nr:hypothetical protein [Pyrofollis japonicus]
MSEKLGVRERVLDFLARHGERAYAVLRAILESYYGSQSAPGVKLGDFSYRDVVNKLRAWGMNYNPSMLLRSLERDYGVIETSYQSRNQHWWRINSPEEIAEALEEYERGVVSDDALLAEEIVDPETELLRLQVASLDPASLLEKLDRLLAKPRLGRAEILLLRTMAFNELELVVKLLRKAEELGYEGPEVAMLKEILVKASRLAKRLLAAAKTSTDARKTMLQLASMTTSIEG